MLASSVLEIAVPSPRLQSKTPQKQETPRFSLEEHDPPSHSSGDTDAESAELTSRAEPDRNRPETPRESPASESAGDRRAEELASAQASDPIGGKAEESASAQERNPVRTWYTLLGATPDTDFEVSAGESLSATALAAPLLETGFAVTPASEQRVEAGLIPLVEALDTLPIPEAPSPLAEGEAPTPDPAFFERPIPASGIPAAASLADNTPSGAGGIRIERVKPVRLNKGLEAPAQRTNLPLAPDSGKLSGTNLPSFDLSAALSGSRDDPPATANKSKASSGRSLVSKAGNVIPAFKPETLTSATIASAREWLRSPESFAERQAEAVLPPRPEGRMEASVPEENRVPVQQQVLRGRTSAPDTATQIRTRMIERFDGKAQRFEIRLDPPELGKVDVRIEIGPDKKMQAILVTRDPAALAELMRGARALEQALQDSGIDVASDGLTFRLDRGGGQSASSGSGEGEEPSSQQEGAASGEAGEEAGNNVEPLPQKSMMPHISSFRRMRLDISA